jgi:hypothetical protein
MNCAIEPEVYGADLRHSCLADFLELEAANQGESRSEADLADYIGDSNWHRLLEPRFTGGGIDAFVNADTPQDRSRDRAAAVINVVEQRSSMLGAKYPFSLTENRRVVRSAAGESYLWFLFVSLAHGLDVGAVPDPATEFEKVVAVGLSSAGLPSLTVGTSAGTRDFSRKVHSIAESFESLVPTLDDAVHSRAQNDGGIDTFGMLRCGRDRRHAQWAFIGQSTVGKTESWLKKIAEPKPRFWKDVFGGRIIPVPFFATPHHVPNDYMHKLADEERCIIDRIRLATWTQNPPESYAAYEQVMRHIELE